MNWSLDTKIKKIKLDTRGKTRLQLDNLDFQLDNRSQFFFPLIIISHLTIL